MQNEKPKWKRKKIKSGERKRWNKYRYIRSVFFWLFWKANLMRWENVLNKISIWFTRLQMDVGTASCIKMQCEGVKLFKYVVSCRMDTDIATYVSVYTDWLWENFCHNVAAVVVAYLFCVRFRLCYSVVTGISFSLFIHKFIYSDGARKQTEQRKGKGKTYGGRCDMKYEMIFKQFNIIPPISELLSYNRIAYFSFLTKFIIIRLKLKDFFPSFSFPSVFLFLYTTMSIGFATRFARAQKKE